MTQFLSDRTLNSAPSQGFYPPPFGGGGTGKDRLGTSALQNLSLYIYNIWRKA